MNRKLTAKAQQIKPNIPLSVKAFSDILIIEPDNQTLMLKKGTIYAIFDVSSSTEFNTQVVSKLIYDTIHDSYYQSENISPIQSLEKAISAVKERVTKMSATEFNILAGVLWGNVMYVVQYGKATSFLMRAGDTRPINANAEGNFSAASGVVKDEDVIVFSTKEFSTQYPIEKLLSTSVQSETLPLEASSLILKFVVDTSFSDTENIDFGIKPIKKTAQSNFFGNIFKKAEKKAEAPKMVTENVKLKLPSKIKVTPLIIIIGTALLLIVSVAVTLRNKANKKVETTLDTEQAKETTEQVITTPTPTPVLNTGYDEATKTQRVNPNVLYDLKISDTQADPTDLVILQNTLIAADSTAGKLYTSSASTPKFTQATGAFPQIGNLNTVGGTLNFTDKDGYKTYDLTNQKVTTTYVQSNIGVADAYLEFVYAFSGDLLVKYTKEDGNFTSSTWAQNADFTGAKSLSIAISIFIVKGDGTIVSYTRGVKDNFNITGLTEPLNNAKQIVTDLDWDNIYIADYGNKRIVIIKKDGTFVKQIKTTTDDMWNDLRAISVTPDEKKLFVLNGSKVFEVSL